MGADLTQAHIALDLAAVELAVQLRPLLLNLRLGLLLQLLGRDRRLAPGHFDQFRCLLVRHPPGVPGQRPDDQKPDAAADEDENHRERPVEILVALGNQKREVGCAH
jgi:hypothetical protein